MSAGLCVLHCAATRDELAAFGLFDAGDSPTPTEIEPGRVWRIASNAVTNLFAITGVGIPHTLLNLAPLLVRFPPALVVNGGIAGAYEGSGLAVGDVVLGVSETFADLGMETPENEEEGGGFLPLGGFPFADASLRAPLPLCAPRLAGFSPQRGRGATVNACTGTARTGARRRHQFDVDFETMEGAAVALAARSQGIPMVELRAISNFASRRDMRPEHIRRAYASLRGAWAAHGSALTEAALRDAGIAPRPEAVA